MEVVYRAFTGTILEKTFTSEEECREYEELNGIKMWDWTGERTDELSEAMVLFMPLDGENIIRKRWKKEANDPEGRLAGIIDEEGDLVCTPGFYFYDTDHHQFFYGGTFFFRSIAAFFKKNGDEINGFFRESVITKYN